MVKHAPPYNLVDDIELKDSRELLEIIKSLNLKILTDNTTECNIKGIALNIELLDIVRGELLKRNLSSKDERQLEKLIRDYHYNIFLFEDWCSCDKSKDTVELALWAREVTKEPWDCVKGCVTCLDKEIEKAKKEKR